MQETYKTMSSVKKRQTKRIFRQKMTQTRRMMKAPRMEKRTMTLMD